MSNEELIRQISERLEEHLRAHLQQIEIDWASLLEDFQALQEPAPEVVEEIEEAERSSVELLRSLAAIEEGSGLKEILGCLAQEISSRAGGCALVILGDPESTVWPGPGLGLAESEEFGEKKVKLGIPDNSLVARAASENRMLITAVQESANDNALFEALESPPPAFSAAIPLAVNGKVQGIVLAGADEEDLLASDPETLAIIVRFTGMYIDQLSLREKVGYVPIASPAFQEAAIEPIEEMEEEPEEELVSETVEELPEPEAVALEEAAEEPTEPESLVFDDSLLPSEEEEEIAVEEEPEPEEIAEEIEDVAEAVKEEEKEEVEEPAEEPVSIPELDIEGYDLDSFSEEDREKHEKAIRFARLLVSEIKLYNEEGVRLGRENADLNTRLKDDIERSRNLYNERISAEIRENTNYFHQELVRQLAEGNEELLGS